MTAARPAPPAKLPKLVVMPAAALVVAERLAVAPATELDTAFPPSELPARLAARVGAPMLVTTFPRRPAPLDRGAATSRPAIAKPAAEAPN